MRSERSCGACGRKWRGSEGNGGQGEAKGIGTVGRRKVLLAEGTAAEGRKVCFQEVQKKEEYLWKPGHCSAGFWIGSVSEGTHDSILPKDANLPSGKSRG